MRESLGQRTETREAALFVGGRHVDAIDAFLDASSRETILFIRGGAGIGKTTLVRELTRRAVTVGYDVHGVDGRQRPPDPGALDAALGDVTASARPLVVLDTFEQLATLGPHLREVLLPELPPSARVVVAGRNPPEPAWQASVWGSVMRTIVVDPMPDGDARSLLDARGVGEVSLREAIVRWADGLPLALALGASAGAIAGADLNVDDLDGALLDHLSGEELEGADRDVLSVAAIAPAVDARLLQAVLPHVDGPQAETWVRGLSFSEPLGRRVTLHDRVRHLVQAEIRRHEPEYDRALRLRIVDHLAERAVTTEPHVIGEMRELVEAEEDHGARVTTALTQFQIDRVRESDHETVAKRFGRDPDSAYAQRFHRWMRDAPSHVIVIREGEELASIGLWATPRNAPWFAADDPILQRWLAHAAEHAPDDNVVFLPDVLILCPPQQVPDVMAIGNVSMLVRSELANLQWAYIAHTVHDHPAAVRAREFGGVREPALDVEIGGLSLVGYVIDYGPMGVVGATRERVRRELKSLTPSVSARVGSREVTTDIVRRALRNVHRPLALAGSPLAEGDDSRSRAASVQLLLRTAVEEAFGAAVSERDQRQVLEIGYLDPDGGHTRAMHQLHLSRTTYYRRLRKATERLTVHLRETLT